MDEHVSPVAWQKEPTFRGTFTILTSCLSTLFICTWSILHVDVQHGKSAMARFRDRCGWLLVGMLAPGIVLSIAINQFLTALSLLQAARRNLKVGSPPPRPDSWTAHMLYRLVPSLRQTTTEAQPEPREPAETDGSPRDRKHSWTLTHGFYASMGGFALGKQRYLPSWQGDGVLTPEGVRMLIDQAPHLIPDIDVEDLLDRSKADRLARLLLLWQLVWFCLNCYIRGSQGLPLSLLEVVTTAHVVCAALTFSVWLAKPKDVGRPTILEGDGIELLGAWMSMASCARRSVAAGMITFTYPSELASLCQRHAAPLASVDHTSLSHIHVPQIPLDLPPSPLTRVLGVLKAKYIFRGKPWPWYIPGTSNVTEEDDGSRYTARLRNCNQAQNRYHGLSQTPPSALSAVYVVPVASLQSFTLTMSPGRGGSRIDITFRTILVLVAFYGYPHLAGYKAKFTTTTERRLWQVATWLILGVGAALVVVLFASLSIKNPYRFMYGMISFGMIVCALSSAYLIAASFRQLVALPPATFILASWSNYLPHFA